MGTVRRMFERLLLPMVGVCCDLDWPSVSRVRSRVIGATLVSLLQRQQFAALGHRPREDTPSISSDRRRSLLSPPSFVFPLPAQSGPSPRLLGTHALQHLSPDSAQCSDDLKCCHKRGFSSHSSRVPWRKTVASQDQRPRRPPQATLATTAPASCLTAIAPAQTPQAALTL